MSESKPSLRGWLFASLAVNLLLVGLIGGAAIGGVRMSRDLALERGAQDAFRPGAFLRDLEPQTRRAVMRDLARMFRETRDERAAQRAAREEVIAAAVAEPYDPERLREAFAQMRAANAAVQEPWHGAVADSMTRLSAEERRDLVERVSRGAVAARLRALRNGATREEPSSAEFLDPPDQP